MKWLEMQCFPVRVGMHWQYYVHFDDSYMLECT